MEPSRIMEFLEFILNLESMTIFFPEEKKEKIISRCETLLNVDQASLRETVNVLGMLNSTYQTVLPDPLQYQSLEMKWQLNNLCLNKRQPVSIHTPGLIIRSDAAKSGTWGAHCQGLVTRGQWSKEEKKVHINPLELKAVKLPSMTFWVFLSVNRNSQIGRLSFRQ